MEPLHAASDLHRAAVVMARTTAKLVSMVVVVAAAAALVAEARPTNSNASSGLAGLTKIRMLESAPMSLGKAKGAAVEAGAVQDGDLRRSMKKVKDPHDLLVLMLAVGVAVKHAGKDVVRAEAAVVAGAAENTSHVQALPRSR